MSCEFRMMHNLSYTEVLSVSFVETAQSLAFIAKVDIEAAFRIILVAPKDTPIAMLDFQRRDRCYTGAFLTVWYCSSCAIFVYVSTAYTAM